MWLSTVWDHEGSALHCLSQGKMLFSSMFKHHQKFVGLDTEMVRWDPYPQLKHKATCEFSVYGPIKSTFILQNKPLCVCVGAAWDAVF